MHSMLVTRQPFRSLERLQAIGCGHRLEPCCLLAVPDGTV